MEDKKLESELCKVDNELEVQGYYQLEKQLESLEKSIKERVLRPKHVVPLLEQGRLLKISKGAVDFGWTMLNRFRKDDRSKPTIVSVEPVYQVEVAVRLSPECLKAARNVQDFRPPAPGETGVWMVEWFDFRCIIAVSSVRLKVAGKPVTFEAKQKVGQNLQLLLAMMRAIIRSAIIQR
ncbi:ATP-dependent RNA helicase DOB1 [Aphelenchoides avenae]|nr:ATP-dependent RNA helicase DOB1 [Aphelenchus avenae]